jgi:hypothetical protein
MIFNRILVVAGILVTVISVGYLLVTKQLIGPELFFFILAAIVVWGGVFYRSIF